MSELSPQERAPLKPSTQVMLAVTHVSMDHDGDPPTRFVCAAALRSAVIAAGIDRFDPPRRPNHQETEWFVDGKCVRNADIYAELMAIADDLEAGE